MSGAGESPCQSLCFDVKVKEILIDELFEWIKVTDI